VPKVAITPPRIEAVRLALTTARQVDPDFWCWLQVAVATGARRGEVCALRWRDVDLDEGIVRIERSVSATASSGIVVKSTKTGRSRVVSLTPQGIWALTERRVHAERAAAEARRAFEESEFIFSSDAVGRCPLAP
jgi:integrase